MTELALPPEIIVPDSVEPYTGYKWLQIRNGSDLYSLHAFERWPQLQPLEARCTHDWGWHWTVAPTGKAMTIAKGWDNVYIGNGNYGRERCWTVNNQQLPEKPPKKPKILLPPNLSWSYEQVSCPHEPVDETCSCGIYAATDTKTASNYKRDNTVLVRVALWGRVIIGDQGARGQYAYPQQVLATTHKEPELMKTVGQAYGIPFPGSDETVALAPVTEMKLNDTTHTRETATITKKKVRRWI